MIFQVALLIFILYILYDRVFLMYYNYWYFKKQGFQPTGFPFPFIGDLLKFLKVLKHKDEYWDDPQFEYFQDVFKKDIPPFVIDFRYPRGILVISDPDFVFESYTTKNKYFDRFPRCLQLKQALKRKHLSSAFYKDKMQLQLNSIISTTFDIVQETIQQIEQGQDQLDLNEYIGKLVLRAVQICIFGVNEKLETLPYRENGIIQQLTLGVFMNRLSVDNIKRVASIFRMNFEFLDNYYVGKVEKEVESNNNTMRRFIIDMISQRKKKNENLRPEEIHHDFLNLLLQDEIFKDNDSLIADECITFMLASTQSITSALSNLIFYVTRDQQICTKVRNEISEIIGKNIKMSKITKEMWTQKLSLDEIQHQWSYLYMVIQENLRIEPPIRKSITQTVSQDIEIRGKKIPKGVPILFHFLIIQRDANEWPDPLKFIPERFDPASKYFLTAEGKKRKPASFTPYLGGRRICLGKTFAENIIKCVAPLIISRLDFELLKTEYRDRKPPNGTFAEPTYPMKISIYQ
ncbi:cytochrome family subfamily polypeptide 55 precursor [Stylonychia lemnae]|uniref:Cytochrome family subfamily polypeptide 55 n=1 Tax=Stylonychia lemnae TaxID=5949 RepID=A0A078B6E3_STYLE|nr:cytochrome family subfamily polypeptide 55 precursor [Stylonychia lemnae]|eukprot:CDW89796.1 cytochrome family subfamily polypeptide 55 precursor [Stylonychia lemnae]